MRLIGINGFKRSGKGETALCIQRALPNLNVLGVGFADKLKMLAALSLGFDREHRGDQGLIDLMDSMKETAQFSVFYDEPGVTRAGTLHELTGRELLQNLGNEARELFGRSFWVDQVLPHGSLAMLEKYPGVDVVCITDLRYANEAARVRALGGVVWEIVRPGLISDGHASEQRLPPALVDRRIDNDGDLLSLYTKIQTALEDL